AVDLDVARLGIQGVGERPGAYEEPVDVHRELGPTVGHVDHVPVPVVEGTRGGDGLRVVPSDDVDAAWALGDLERGVGACRRPERYEALVPGGAGRVEPRLD